MGQLQCSLSYRKYIYKGLIKSLILLENICENILVDVLNCVCKMIDDACVGWMAFSGPAHINPSSPVVVLFSIGLRQCGYTVIPS